MPLTTTRLISTPLISRLLLSLCLLMLSFLARAESDDEFLPVGEAFKVSADVEGHQIHYTWVIADGYYLYKHRFSFAPSTNEAGETSVGAVGEPRFEQEGEWKDDPIFGRVLVFHNQVDVRVPVTATDGGFIEVAAGYQGCADKGLCYIPQTFTNMYQVDPAAIAAAGTDDIKSPDLDALKEPAAETQGAVSPDMDTEKPAAKPASMTKDTDVDTDDALSLERFLSSNGFFTIIGLFFLIGIGLTFTPCVLPMVPILSSIIVGQGKELSRPRAALLSSIYVLGMATTYAVAGVIAGLSGQNLTVAMQNPTVLFSFAGLFAVLSLSMFGFYELQLPAFVRDRLNAVSQKQQGGTYAGVAVIGVLSALIVSPCVSAPLAGALLYLGKTGDWQLGGASLLALGLGMGVPLIAVGVTGANVLPKAGGWMDNVKALFGVMLLAVALWLIKHLVPATVLGIGWGLLAILAGLYLGAFDTITSTKGKLFKGIGIAALITGAVLIFNALAAPSSTPENAVAEASTSFQRIRTAAQLDEQLAMAASAKQPVMLDFYADWCTACIEMEHENFTRPDVQALLRNHTWLQLDLTNNPEDQALLSRFGIPGPPAILFFGPNGQEISTARIYAYKSRPQFTSHLKQHGIATAD